MPYKSITELPKGVQHVLPEHAQEIYKEAFNHASIEYADASKRRSNESLEETASRVAWAAVERTYTKDQTGTWRKK
jgi:cation transport regulator